MTDGRRDQRPFNIVQQYLPGLILSTILNTVKEMGDPYQARGSVTLSCASNWGLSRLNELGVNFGHATTRYVDVRRGVPVSFVECHYKALRVAS